MVTRQPHLSNLSQHSAVSRIVAGLLLVFVIYGTTVEAAHRHGRLFGSEQSTSASLSSDDTGKSAADSFLSCSECLICQLHSIFRLRWLPLTIPITSRNRVALFPRSGQIPSKASRPRRVQVEHLLLPLSFCDCFCKRRSKRFVDETRRVASFANRQTQVS